jgi:hypothetical protein
MRKSSDEFQDPDQHHMIAGAHAAARLIVKSWTRRAGEPWFLS